MIRNRRLLRASDVISFSAGFDTEGPIKFRLVRSSEDRLADVVSRFPKLHSAFQTTPIIINCYPAPLGAFPSAVFCDTYLRQSAFSRAMKLCSMEKCPAVILGQPLAVADLLFHHVNTGGTLPRDSIICVGGYYCPQSLETYIQRFPEELGWRFGFFHAYGVAEVDFAVFVGERPPTSRHIIYWHVAPSVVYRLTGDELELRRINDESFIPTGDRATPEGDGSIAIQCGKRLDSQVVELLESWTHKEWCRRTGYLGLSSDGTIRFQLRKGETPRNDSELKFGAFQDLFSVSWLDKPDWSISR
jgi:hypothetical protein